MAQENRARIDQTRQKSPGFTRGHMQVLRCDQIRQANGLIFVTSQDKRPEPLQAIPGQVASAQSSQLLLQRDSHSIRSDWATRSIRMLAPGECSAWLIRSAAI